MKQLVQITFTIDRPITSLPLQKPLQCENYEVAHAYVRMHYSHKPEFSLLAQEHDLDKEPTGFVATYMEDGWKVTIKSEPGIQVITKHEVRETLSTG